MLSYYHKICVCFIEACEFVLKEKHFFKFSHLEQLEVLGKVFNKVAEDDMHIKVTIVTTRFLCFFF